MFEQDAIVQNVRVGNSLGFDNSFGAPLERVQKVRHCKICKEKTGKNVRLSSYNLGENCWRHPTPEKTRRGARCEEYREEHKK